MKTLTNTPQLIRQETRIFEAMTKLYCKSIHRSGQICPHCVELLQYTEQRLAHCIVDSDKPSCSKCERQCYNVAKRLEVNHIIRWATPKMRWRKPLLVVKHVVEDLFQSK